MLRLYDIGALGATQTAKGRVVESLPVQGLRKLLHMSMLFFSVILLDFEGFIELGRLACVLCRASHCVHLHTHTHSLSQKSAPQYIYYESHHIEDF